MPNSKNRELVSIQVMRGTAALTVLFYHIGIEIPKFFRSDNFPYLQFGGVGVDLFFIISGLIMVFASEKNFGSLSEPVPFVLRRVVRIVPLYWIATTLILAQLAYFYLKVGDLGGINSSAAAVLASFAFIPYPAPSGEVLPLLVVGWTLNYEMFFYLLFAGFLVFSKYRAVAAISALLIAGVAANTAFGPFLMPLGFWFDEIILEFIMGMGIGLLMRNSRRIPEGAGLVLLGLAALALGYIQIRGPTGLPRSVEFGLPAAAIMVAVVLTDWRVLKPKEVTIAPLAAVGAASYSLYLLHLHVFWLVERAHTTLLFRFVVGPWLYAAVLLVGSVAVAFLSYHLLEKPMTSWLNRRLGTLFCAKSHPPAIVTEPAVCAKP